MEVQYIIIQYLNIMHHTIIVNQNYWDKDYDNYNDIYAYVATKNVNLRKDFYMALGRERYGMYKSN